MTIHGEMRPCPFCGCEDLKLEGGQMVCTSCRAKGPTKGVPTEDEETRAYVWWNNRDINATEEAYETVDGSRRCPFCGYSRNRFFECLSERGYAHFCEACGARGPMIPYYREDRCITEEVAKELAQNAWIHRDYMTARNALYGRVVI